ncbi:MAG: hypothetical protein KDI01_10470 [Halioglobus sp.]|nr:hypothetical protein [Halioglobus sp.]
MLSINKLEKVIELEDKLRAEYQAQLDAKSAQIESHIKDRESQQAAIEARQATIDKQLETISELSGKASVSQRTEQLNRELTNRAEKLQDEVSELKKRVKTLQKDLAAERAQNKALKQFDPARMKKNLDANKKKLAEEFRANDALQKSQARYRAENAKLQGKVKELEARLEELEPGEAGEDVAA